MQVFHNGVNQIKQAIDVKDNVKSKACGSSNSSEPQGSGIDFQSVLKNKFHETNPLMFSKHANQRLNTRNIQLSPEQLSRVQNGISQAEQKGINDSLVVVDNIRLVVNIKNKVVITAMSTESENVFTNIDGAVIV